MKEKIAECFKILEIEPTGSLEDIRAAYRKQQKKWHPDKVTNKSEEVYKKYTIKSQKINEAFEFIVNLYSLIGEYARKAPTGELEKVYVVSSNLEWVQYDKKNFSLKVKFKSSRSFYRYPNVQPYEYEALLRAPSKGKFFIKYIKWKR